MKLKKKIKKLRIIRPFNCFMSAFAVSIGYLIAGGGFYSLSKLVLADLTTFLVTGAGNTINDYFDREIDKINSPYRPIPSGEISPKSAYLFSILLFSIGIILSAAINYICLLIVVINSFLLYLYASKFKSIPFFGNLAVGVIVGSTFLFGGASIGKIRTNLILFGLALLATLGREIAKDIEDIKGDQGSVNTIATEYGIENAAKLSIFFTILAISLSPLPYLLGIFGIYFLITVAIADLIFLYSSTNLLTSINIEGAKKYQKLSKIAMFFALIAFIVGSLS
ncbi:MAG: 4-hydroxybenzoate polyprenyltransferase family prenyltransferase UbiA [Candidatus Methanohalarchaeum thermophilum]|uniref:Digeranylgeranylglyceryl phosphate synthase n=1 Tax=Methanohalarchaeum thermophilum TaxID=1903181 RepID=A0A1Q6DTA2_METT1|nr:MAG: 4-hydroxybenzoate polyprenyltransferase family prenyltransferase UbiA [Candidatus Methanohalarchaeum thermophilum]